MPKLSKNKKGLIVLIEDENIVISLLTRKLEEAGYTVKAARDGLTGLALIREHKPNLVLLDMLLPRLGGMGVLEKLEEEGWLPKLPIIIVSNSGQPVEIERAMKMGVRDYLIKVNFDPGEVLEKVNIVMKSEGGENKTIAEETSPSANILIIEDDVFLIGLMETKFSQRNYKIYKALDVKQAYQVLDSTKIDIILLDIILPGLDGFSFLGAIKSNEKYKNIPVLIISNLSQKEEVEKGLKLGASDYLIKAHVSPEEIVKKVISLIKSGR